MDPAEHEDVNLTPAEILHKEGEEFCLARDLDSGNSIEDLVNPENQLSCLINRKTCQQTKCSIKIGKRDYEIVVSRYGFYAEFGNDEPVYLGTNRSEVIKSLRELKERFISHRRPNPPEE